MVCCSTHFKNGKDFCRPVQRIHKTAVLFHVYANFPAGLLFCIPDGRYDLFFFFFRKKILSGKKWNFQLVILWRYSISESLRSVPFLNPDQTEKVLWRENQTFLRKYY